MKFANEGAKINGEHMKESKTKGKIPNHFVSGVEKNQVEKDR